MIGRFVLACLIALPLWSCADAERKRPDLIVITLDTTRADHLGAYGYERPVSPRLDAFAADAILYERAWSTASWTLPAHASLFTGQHPTSHGAHFDEARGTLTVQGELARQRDAVFRVNPLAESAHTLAELAQQAGYATGAFVGGPWLAPEFGVLQGKG